MVQFPLLGNLLSSDLKSLPGAQSTLNPGPGSLLVEGEDALAGFSAELQSLLMSLDPQLVKRLDELLAGGMPLPQAAKSLLSGLTGPMPLMSGGLALGNAEIALPVPADGLNRDGAPGAEIGKLLGAVAQLQRPGNELAQQAAAAVGPPSGGPAPLPAQMQAFAPQLTANLLDMGVPQPVTDKGWGQAIADRVVWMVQGEQQTARLKLNPPNLGPLEVRVSVSHDQASVSFVAQHAVVREALEAAMPRLREMFDQQSLNLVQTDVSDSHAEQGGSADGFGQPSAGGALADGDEPLDQADPAAITTVGDIGVGLVDLFA